MTNAESKAAAILGRKGGSSKSEAKVKAARDNGKLGGRPRVTDMRSRAKMIWSAMSEEERSKALVYYCNRLHQVHHNCEHGGTDFTPKRQSDPSKS